MTKGSSFFGTFGPAVDHGKSKIVYFNTSALFVFVFSFVFIFVPNGMLTSGRERSQHLYILTWASYKRNTYMCPTDILPRDVQIAVSYTRMTDCAMRMMPPLTTVGLMESLSVNGRLRIC